MDNIRQQQGSSQTSQQRKRLHPVPGAVLGFFAWYFVGGYRVQNIGSFAICLLAFVVGISMFVYELVTWSWDKNSIWILAIVGLGLAIRLYDGWRRGERIF